MSPDFNHLSYKNLISLWNQALKNRNIMAFGELSDYLGKSEFAEDSLEQELYDRYSAEKMKLADKYIPKEKPILKAEVNKICYKINGFKDAERIVNRHNWSELYLRDLVSIVTGNGAFADSLDYRGLKHQGYVILGIAKRVLKARNKDL